jgi:hypothetical protein
MSVFFALSTAMGFVVMGAGYTTTYANPPSPTQATYVRIDDAPDFKPIEPLAASAAEELSTSVGPAEGSPDHRSLEKETGCGYRQVLGEFTHAYVVGRVDISYAVTLLAHYLSAPDRCIDIQHFAIQARAHPWCYEPGGRSHHATRLDSTLRKPNNNICSKTLFHT